MTDEQRPAEQCGECQHDINDCVCDLCVECFSKWKSHNSELCTECAHENAPLSDIVRKPETKREERLIGSLRVYWLHGYRIELQGIHGEIFGKWILSRPGYSTFKPLAFDYAADALAHAEQLAEGEG